MIHAGAIGRSCDRLRHMRMRSKTELIEGTEELIVPGLLARLPVAHGPCIDHLVIEDMIAVSAASGRLGGIDFTWIARRRQQAGRSPVHTEAAGGGEIDQIFRIDCAIKMIVQISAFRHLVQECEQQTGLLAHRLEITAGALFRALRRGECSQQHDQQAIRKCGTDGYRRH